MTYLVKKVTYEPIDVDPAQLITLKDAADYLEINLYTLKTAADRGKVTLIMDPAVTGFHGRRLLLRSEVEQWKKTGKPGRLAFLDQAPED